MPTNESHDEPKAAGPPNHPIASPPSTPLFEVSGNDIYTATLAASEPRTPLEHARRLLFGQPIPERLAGRERLNRTRALATLSSDALSSVAYGTEAALAVLVAAGFTALSTNLGIGLVTAALMIIVGYSYRQTIHAYPSGGGSYIVARDNLGVVAGLIAAAALLIDYLLTVSVSVASGVDAIASAFQVISPVKLEIELAAIVFILMLNLPRTPIFRHGLRFPDVLLLRKLRLDAGGRRDPGHSPRRACPRRPDAGERRNDRIPIDIPFRSC